MVKQSPNFNFKRLLLFKYISLYNSYYNRANLMFDTSFTEYIKQLPSTIVLLVYVIVVLSVMALKMYENNKGKL